MAKRKDCRHVRSFCRKNSITDKEINIERTEEALSTGANVIAAACPFCLTMLTDGTKIKEKEEDVEVKDIAELIAEAEDII